MIKKLLIILPLLLLSGCDYTSESPTFRYPTPIPVVISGTPIAVLVPTPAPTATPIPPVNTATPQPTPTPDSVRVIGTSNGTSTSTVGFNTDIDMGSGGFGTATELEIQITVRCQTQNCGTLNLAIATNGNDFFSAIFGNPIPLDTVQMATVRNKRVQNSGSLFTHNAYVIDSGGTATELAGLISAGINWSDDWSYRLEWSGVTSGGTVSWIVNIERIN